MDFHDLTVAGVDRLTEDSVVVTFAVPDELEDEFSFLPGQHLVLERERMRRTYSICAPADSGQLRVGIRHLPGGAFSSWANAELKAGDRLAVSAPRGTFTVSPDPGRRRRYGAIAAGSGITPILSIIASILEREPQARVALAYGNRSSATTMFLEELQDLKDAHPDRLELIHVFSREPQAVDLFSGRLDAERLEALFQSLLPVEEIDEWFLCGPLEMTEMAGRLLSEHGAPVERVKHEVFYAEIAPSPRRLDDVEAGGGEATVKVALDGRESTLTMPRDGGSILDAVLAVRGDAPYACKGGVCGTCRAKVLDGEVRMDFSYALEPGEIEQGFVLACQAHPATPDVVIDFDQ